MDRWAATIPSVAFVCVCCAEPALAFAFRDRLGLKSCYNCIVREDAAPTWGQLGCSGFIILDSDLKVVCPSTLAFLDVQDAAFRDVEAKLAALMSGSGSENPPDEIPQQENDHGRNCESGNCALRIRPSSPAHTAAHQDVQPLADIEKTGIADMDEEHDECAQALEHLRESRSSSALASVLQCLEAHFSHEETLLDSTLYVSAASPAGSKRKSCEQDREAADSKSASAPGFSAVAGARKSHYADHARILGAVQDCLEDIRETAERLVPEHVIDALLRDFENHASRYDDAYRVQTDLESPTAVPAT